MEIVTFEKNKLVSEIQDVLNSWLNEKPEVRSVASLSRATGVADPAIRRLMNSNVKINDDAIFKLLAYIFDVQTFNGISVALSQKPEALKWFERSYAFMKNSAALQQYKHTPTADIISNNPVALAVYALISEMENVSIAYIKEQFGAVGEFELEKMLQKEVVFLETNGSLRVKDLMLKLTKDQVIDNLPDLARLFFKKDHEFNARILNFASVSREGYVKLMDIVDAFSAEVAQVAKDYKGEIPVVTAGFFDSMTTVPYFEGGKNENSN